MKKDGGAATDWPGHPYTASRPKGAPPHEAHLLRIRRARLAGAESMTRPVWERDAPHGSRKNRAAIIEVGFLEERPHTGIPLTMTVRGCVVGAS